jgi:hypothetical protein
LHVDLDEADFLAIFPLAGEGRTRLIGTVRCERAERGDQPRFEDVSDRAIKNLRVTVDQMHWFSTYRVHHRVARRFRKDGRFCSATRPTYTVPPAGRG